MRTLALFGGTPLKPEPFASPVIIDDQEIALVNEVIRSGELSRFMGSRSADIDAVLEMPSAEAVDYQPQYFTFLGGRMVRRFEAAFAKLMGTRYAISVNSATSGLTSALAAIGVGPGDEVITTCMSFNATATSVLPTNAVPIFVDVAFPSFCLDPELVRNAVTPRTKAILVVHLLGNTADMDAIMAIAAEHGLAVVEDCAQSPRSLYKDTPVGTIGDLGVYSFQETKNMTTGEGGMVVTNDPRHAARVRLIRNHGESIPDDTWPVEALAGCVGYNFRMTELQAAVGIGQTAKLVENNRVRSENARYLAARLRDLPGLDVPAWVDDPGIAVHVLPILFDEAAAGVSRDKVIAAIRAEGVPVGPAYPRLMPENPVFKQAIAFGAQHCPFSCPLRGSEKRYAEDSFPVAERLLREQFIWFYHVNRPNALGDMQTVADAFASVLASAETLSAAEVASNGTYKW